MLGDDEGMAALEMIRAMVGRVVLYPCPSDVGLEACAESDPKSGPIQGMCRNVSPV